MGSTSCNAPYLPDLANYPAPDVPADWNDSANPPGNPVIGQQLYRLAADNLRIEQIGLSWVKHAFCAVSEGTCGTCQSTSCDTLGIGCADTYGQTLNAGPGYVGPRWECNPQGVGRGGVHDDIYVTPNTGANVTNGRLQVKDVDIVNYPGARFFGEIQYLCHDEALARRGNNASYREMFFSGTTMTGAAGGQASVFWGQPAIMAWKNANPNVTFVKFTDDPGAGIFHLAYLVTDNGDDTWTYEYALHNLTSHRSARGFSVPVGLGATVSGIGFHDVFYHSGDGWNSTSGVPVTFDGTDWAVSAGSGSVSWSTADFATNPNANALRWGTMYNYRFTTDTAPVADNATVTMYRTGGQASVTVPILRPDGIPAPICPPDLAGSKGGAPDGVVDVFDLFVLLANWGTSNAGADLAPDNNIVDVFDLFVLLAAWGDC